MGRLIHSTADWVFGRFERGAIILYIKNRSFGDRVVRVFCRLFEARVVLDSSCRI